MSAFDSETAAKQLVANRSNVSNSAPRLPSELRPSNIHEALLIQSYIIQQYPSSVGGWKCLLPFDDRVIVAPIFADGIQSGDQCTLIADKGHARVEPEIAFVLGADLPAQQDDYSQQEIDTAIGSCHMALELIQSRFADDSGSEFLEALADGLVNQGLFLGPEINREQAFTASHINIEISQLDQQQTFDGVHPNQAPVSPIYWLINYMSKRGVSFQKGQAIITGSYCGVVNLAFDQATKVTYQGIGEYSVTMKEKVL